MSTIPEFEVVHLRLLWLIYNSPGGMTAAELVDELKRRRWCEPTLTPEHLGLHPLDILDRPA